MSDYLNFIKYFPRRCSDLLKYYKFAKWVDREVTFMLTVVSAGLTIPMERLELKNYPYPFKDRDKHPNAKAKLDELLEKQFIGSILLPRGPKSWRFGNLSSIDGDPDSWVELTKSTVMSSDKTVKSVVKHIRNALAHGSIHTRGNPISDIIFVASVKPRSPKFNYMIVAPHDLHTFTLNWFKFINAIEF